MQLKDDIRSSSSDPELVASRREHIARCAIHAFVKKGYDRTNVDEIADACGMSKGNLYNYVGSKEDILYLVIDRSLCKLAELVEGFLARSDNASPTKTLREFIEVYYRGVDGDSDSFLFTYQETKNLSPTAQRRVLDAASRDVAVCEELLRRGVESGEFRINKPVLVAHNIIALGHMWAVRRWFLGKRCTLEEYIREQTESIMKAILVDERATIES